MDTKRDFDRDRWMEEHLGQCCTCRYWELEKVDHGHVCVSDKSEHRADWVEENDGCEEWRG